jgi:DNA-binding NarL/FixJ family response regulator
MSIRVAVIHADFLIREGVAAALSEADDITLVGTAARLDQMTAMIERTSPDVVITGLVFSPGEAGHTLVAFDRLQEHRSGLAVVVLSRIADPVLVRMWFAAGAARRAYMLTDRVPDAGQLFEAVRAVASGGSFIEPSVIGPMLVDGLRQQSALERLTPREVEILALVSDGLSNQAVADAAGINVRAVEQHLHSIFQKLELDERSDTNRRVLATLVYRRETTAR